MTKSVGDFSDRLCFCHSNNDTELYFTYIIQSTTTGQFYVGSCSNILKRFNDHQSGYSKATRGRGPWWMPYYEIYPTRSEAQSREYKIKSKKSSKYIKKTIYVAYPLLELL